MINYNCLKQMMRRNQYTYDKVSKYLGYKSPATFWKIVNGSLQMKAIHLKKLADLFNVNVECFFADSETEDMPSKGGRRK